ncbi:MAG: hypothetical protein CL840_14155 [Crocinitomicaceae bacterium]|nr:hypothetical protein [Crocinitomicaceae bacterium]|tara:strand:+ start:4107 stop:4772 length:666 start_codon:yes stop_codon:yes gene_type:complete
MLRIGFSFLVATLVLLSCNKGSGFELKEGDILFQDLDCGVYCESIETVTLGYNGANLSHCGIVVMEGGRPHVIEAISKGVSLTALDSFLVRSSDKSGKPKVLVGRLKKGNEFIVENAIVESRKHLGKDYDPVYDIENDKMYCSELVYFSFKDQGEFLFNLNPMTFKALGSDSTFADWQTYFDDLQQPVPEGKPGLNPGSISLSDQIEIVYQFGSPDGMEWE